MKLDYHNVKFGGHRYSDNGDIVVLVCQIISQDHVIDFTGRRPSR